jgi:hypothetical protein
MHCVRIRVREKKRRVVEEVLDLKIFIQRSKRRKCEQQKRAVHQLEKTTTD